MTHKKYLNLMCLIAVLMCCCGEEPPDVEDLGKSVTKISFGEGWDSNNNVLLDTTRYFDDPNGTYIVYYEIQFEKDFNAGGMIKKAWTLDYTPFLEATSFMPKYTRRICGEIHFYDSQTAMDVGEYTLDVSFFCSSENDYIEYDMTADPTFEVLY